MHTLTEKKKGKERNMKRIVAIGAGLVCCAGALAEPMVKIGDRTFDLLNTHDGYDWEYDRAVTRCWQDGDTVESCRDLYDYRYIDGDMPVGPDSEGGRVLAFTPGTFAGGCVRGTVSIASGLSGATLYFCQAADYSGEDTVWTESAIGSAVGAGELSRQIAQNVANGNYIVRIKATLGDYDYWSEPFSIAEMRGYGNAGLVICIH